MTNSNVTATRSASAHLHMPILGHMLSGNKTNTTATGVALSRHVQMRKRIDSSPMTRRWPCILLAMLCLLAAASAAVAEGTWLVWSGVETIGGPMWTDTGASYPSREACQEGADTLAQQWEQRMKARGRDPVRTGTDVITRLESGSIVLVHFVCLPDTTDPRQKR